MCGETPLLAGLVDTDSENVACTDSLVVVGDGVVVVLVTGVLVGEHDGIAFVGLAVVLAVFYSWRRERKDIIDAIVSSIVCERLRLSRVVLVCIVKLVNVTVEFFVEISAVVEGDVPLLDVVEVTSDIEADDVMGSGVSAFGDKDGITDVVAAIINIGRGEGASLVDQAQIGVNVLEAALTATEAK